MRGRVIIDAPIRPNMIRIGFGQIGIFDERRSRAVWHVDGTVIFRGQAAIGHGTKLSVGGVLTLGHGLNISAETEIVCTTRITLGEDVLIAWDCLLMDSDLHTIYDRGDGSLLNANAPISIGNHVWIGARSVILKDITIANGVVVAANSGVYGSVDETNCIIGGAPARVLRHNIRWDHGNPIDAPTGMNLKRD